MAFHSISFSSFFFFFSVSCFFFELISCLQPYDKNPCPSKAIGPGSRYSCNSSTDTCQSFLVYRSKPEFQNISAIAGLFEEDPGNLTRLNNLRGPSQVLELGRDVLVPITCSCTGEFFQANYSYTVSTTTSFSEIACDTFEGLLKSQVLSLANPQINPSVVEAGTSLHVPLKCACPDNASRSAGLKYLVTYPFIEGDGTTKLSKKFNISIEELWAANNFTERPTVFAGTTFLVPLESPPVIYFNGSKSHTQRPLFIPFIITNSTRSNRNKTVRMIYIGDGVGLFTLVLLLIVFGIIHARRDRALKMKKVETSHARGSPNACLSPNLVIRMSTLTYLLNKYSTEEISAATGNFGESAKMGSSAHRGRIENSEVVVQQIAFDEIHKNINIYSKINHANILKLRGVCYGEINCSPPYLVFDFDGNCTLRGCILNRSDILQWKERVQLAFDIASGLHYLHHCSVPSYTHMNINSENILVTQDGRGKIANLGAACIVGSIEEKRAPYASTGGRIAPEYLLEGLISAKVDVFGFGVVLLELLSGENTTDGSSFEDFSGLSRGSETEGVCFEKLTRNFIDPYLKDDYVIGEAVCMTILAKTCLEDNPVHRPSMDEILKILARMA